jgi:hypothetical protein
MPTTHTLHHLFLMIICSEDVQLLNSSLRNFLHLPVPSTVLVLNVCLIPQYMCYSLMIWLQNLHKIAHEIMMPYASKYLTSITFSLCRTYFWRPGMISKLLWNKGTDASISSILYVDTLTGEIFGCGQEKLIISKLNGTWLLPSYNKGK